MLDTARQHVSRVAKMYTHKLVKGPVILAKLMFLRKVNVLLVYKKAFKILATPG